MTTLTPQKLKRLQRAEAVIRKHYVENGWFGKDIYSTLEDAVTYQGHSEICGCDDEAKKDSWSITITMIETKVRQLMSELSAARQSRRQG